MATGGGPYVPQVVDTTPELEVVFPSIEHNIPNTGDSDEVPTVEAAAVPEVHEVPPSTAKHRKGSKRSVVEREAEERLAKVRCLREEEAYVCQMRRELLMMDMKVKEDESAAAAAKRLSAENEAAASASLRAAAEAQDVAAKLQVEEARQRVAAATKLAANAEAAGRQQRELFELQKEELMRKMGHPPR
ncbi:translation initiation factor IF-2-like [Ischnura elegans]|uniref:translation initiation factor IF-2-like n=1 Tax=Ischnura elegans TaxID=197161 RepID=UPI001ED8799E|nr:translation initiation factor IF-2-like [Ischnura elegans]